MSATIAATPPVTATELHSARPTFIGLVRGELFKISKQRATWVLAILLLGIICFPFLINFAIRDLKDRLALAPLDELYRNLAENLLMLRIFSGTFLILVTARLIGMEYSGGTIRVLLSRGVGRVQLLGAKLSAVGIVALGVLVFGVAIQFLLSLLQLLLVAGNLDAMKAANSAYWSDAWTYVLTIAFNMVVTILMATAVTVIGRSLAVGLSAGLAFFAVDNIGTIFLFLASRITGSNFWLLLSGDLLGPNLNTMPNKLLSSQADPAKIDALATPFVPVTGAHTILVACVWAAAFIVVAVVLTARRDVTE
ncbi:MAG TPA: ABC transporter permease subunit [Ktedonobacterales bacterium]|nr:ABC transporter permease subunit [Ktedonobacterales bacterium]